MVSQHLFVILLRTMSSESNMSYSTIKAFIKFASDVFVCFSNSSFVLRNCIHINVCIWLTWLLVMNVLMSIIVTPLNSMIKLLFSRFTSVYFTLGPDFSSICHSNICICYALLYVMILNIIILCLWSMVAMDRGTWPSGLGCVICFHRFPRQGFLPKFCIPLYRNWIGMISYYF